jgi:hypothetical protein
MLINIIEKIKFLAYYYFSNFHNFKDIDLILTLNSYFMLLSQNSDILNTFTNYIKYYIQG